MRKPSPPSISSRSAVSESSRAMVGLSMAEGYQRGANREQWRSCSVTLNFVARWALDANVLLSIDQAQLNWETGCRGMSGQPGPSGSVMGRGVLEAGNSICLRTLLTLDDVELHFIALFKRFVTVQ